MLPLHLKYFISKTILAEETKYSAQYSVQEIIRHPEYQANTVQNDIALLITTIDIEWSRGVGPICLPSFAAK